jgi:hypothetical protein
VFLSYFEYSVTENESGIYIWSKTSETEGVDILSKSENNFQLNLNLIFGRCTSKKITYFLI